MENNQQIGDALPFLSENDQSQGDIITSSFVWDPRIGIVDREPQEVRFIVDTQGVTEFEQPDFNPSIFGRYDYTNTYSPDLYNPRNDTLLAQSSIQIGNTNQVRQTTDVPALMPDVQHTRRARTNYGDAFNDAIEAYHPFGSCVWGAIEILTFHPLGTQQPLAGVRLAQNGWTELDIAKAQLYARDRHSHFNVHQKYETLKHEMNKNGRIVYRDPAFTASRYKSAMRHAPTANYSSASYMPRHRYFYDPKTFQPADPSTMRSKGGGQAAQQNTPSLIRMAVGVTNWPQGQDAGIVTQAIQWAVRHQDHSLTVHDIPNLSLTHGFVAPAESNAIGWDQSAKDRIIAVVDASAKYNAP